MARSIHDVTYALVPGLILLFSMSVFTMQIVKVLQHIDGSILAYANCANQMVNYAFMGQVFNFSQCYLQELNSTTLNCQYQNNEIVCTYNSTVYTFPLNK